MGHNPQGTFEGKKTCSGPFLHTPRVSVLRIVRRSTAARRGRMQLPPRVVTNRGDAALRQIT